MDVVIHATEPAPSRAKVKTRVFTKEEEDAGGGGGGDGGVDDVIQECKRRGGGVAPWPVSERERVRAPSPLPQVDVQIRDDFT